MASTIQKFPDARFEFRVWGFHQALIERLASAADVDRTRQLTDCYLLTPDPALNVKIRQRRLKIKRLVEEQAGLQRWASTWHRNAAEAPKPFDGLFKELAQWSEGNRTPNKLAKAINTTDLGLKAVAVTKHRRRLRLGSIRVESAELMIADRPERLGTLAIEGRNVDDLLHLRSELGFSSARNVAIHLAINPECKGVAELVASAHRSGEA